MCRGYTVQSSSLFKVLNEYLVPWTAHSVFESPQPPQRISVAMGLPWCLMVRSWCITLALAASVTFICWLNEMLVARTQKQIQRNVNVYVTKFYLELAKFQIFVNVQTTNRGPRARIQHMSPIQATLTEIRGEGHTDIHTGIHRTIQKSIHTYRQTDRKIYGRTDGRFLDNIWFLDRSIYLPLRNKMC